MKNQYFADINDYHKYALLRALSGNGAITTAVCWMRTEDDSSRDGGKLQYLNNPSLWRSLDPELFDILSVCTRRNSDRCIDSAGRYQIIPRARYFSPLLTDNREERTEYFTTLFKTAAGADLLFFDPDNGIEVPSVPCGRKRSSKYLYRNEIATAYQKDFSLLIFQHFPRVERHKYMTQRARQLCSLLSCQTITLFQTSHVLYMLVSAPRHRQHFRLMEKGIGDTRISTIKVHHFS